MEDIQAKTCSFKALFKGREDVFAMRWEKGNKSGCIITRSCILIEHKKAFKFNRI